MKTSNKVLAGVVVAMCLMKYGPDPHNLTAQRGPIEGKGLRVLILHETSQDSKLPADQTLIFDAKAIRDYLNENCAKEKSKNPAWRIFDPNHDTTKEAKFWQEVMNKVKDSPMPWCVVSNGRKGISRPLPKDVPAMKALLDEYK